MQRVHVRRSDRTGEAGGRAAGIGPAGDQNDTAGCWLDDPAPAHDLSQGTERVVVASGRHGRDLTTRARGFSAVGGPFSPR